MTFKPNRDFERQLKAHPAVQRALADKAEEALAAAQQIASEFENTGAYKRSLAVEDGTLYSTDPAAWIIEFGSTNSPVYAPLRKAAEQVGGRVTDSA